MNDIKMTCENCKHSAICKPTAELDNIFKYFSVMNNNEKPENEKLAWEFRALLAKDCIHFEIIDW